ncbi:MULTISPECIES: two-component sensor histidine kinase BarA [Vibrio]|jgi:two-component system sensor histidine kinase BarA|uniref:two-component sensor histidine kinase BarA n=1 Tax=Vibrio TaxID=662 RepID=UPI0002E8147B|nr:MULTISPECIES: two-component sensor histidine kinase BarA [Vibrio]ANP75592.1 two-component sensor histidine kinase BarA [Vibrio crassostreae 9CS106]OED74955.1 two-component sensor histidine kinase BarA [Vibrio crassostreae ZF-91]OEE90521.1 two-component sensor histidine kinase BarA [Vibrio crassostreae 9ZC88]TKF93382.1 two-component sensor histidine kinase BarA [Vibrio sp. F13]TKG34908.1 two-component sensor histidine kinase BarA [Vibrio sp. F13]
MTRYGLRARVITLTLAPTLIIGLLLSAFFSFNRYQDLEGQVVNTGTSIIEPLAITSESGMKLESRESVRQLISYAHRKNSKLVRSIAVFDERHELFVTSNFHPDFESLTYPKDKPIPHLSSSNLLDNTLILRTPIIAEGQYINSANGQSQANQAIGYIAIELDLSSLRLQQYQEVFSAFLVLILGLGLSGVFAFRLMHDVTQPITHMKNMVDRIRRGHLDVRIEGKMHGELDSLKNGINAMAVSLSEYHVEMQHSIDQATSDLRETLEQLEIQNVELDIAKKRAQEAARVKSEFLANMSHELRTPLNGVIGFTRQMLKTHLSNSQTDYLQTIERSANNLLSIINDILDFSKLEAGKLALENIPFEFQASLEEVVNLQATNAHEKGLELTLKIDPKVPPGVVGDPLRIQQILTNLVGNSIKFTERGNIDISVELRSQSEDNIELQFMVRDTGIGISERQQAQLFQAFSQADASISRRYGGTGLGLVITQKLVSQMGGEISLTSRLHQGSTFWFTLRLSTTDMPMTELIETQCLQDKQLLLIEPNMQAASITQQILTQEGLVVTYRSVMPDETTSYDYVLLNLAANQEYQFDTVSGWAIGAKKIAQNVIIGTPSTELALGEQLMKEVDVQCITKPLSRKKLLQTLVSNQAPTLIAPAIETHSEEKLPLTVMAVDDNPANLKLITALLKERVETVISCTSGQQAIDKATETPFDIIFMDIQMPQMDGVTACQNIKKLANNANTPVIAVTAHAMIGERDRLLEAGMDDYLTKPIEEHVLQQVLIHWSSTSEVELIEKIDPDHPAVSAEVDNGPVSETEASVHTNIIIDWQAAMKQAANKEDLARDMLQMLVDFIPEVYEAADKAIEDSDYPVEELIHIIHKMHGSSSYSGVPRLKSVCATIEKELRSGTSVEDIEPELFELQDELDKVQATAIHYLKQAKA